ncbi:hypothetical protein Leryth_008000 [Lithospermum erythrorhizon]|nr:hypothetical protein Leryth_008000 [Lithospermum erythrorhizon]
MTNGGGSQNDEGVTLVENMPMLDSSMKATIIISRKLRGSIIEKFEEKFESFFNISGQGMIIQLISEELDPTTKAGKIFKASLQSRSHPSENPNTVEYTGDLEVPHDFGSPGAILLTNLLDKEFHLVEIVLHGFKGGPIHFPANSWIHSHNDNSESRILFKNQACLPSQTPPGIKDLRGEELSSIRGNGKGERQPHERIYDYDVYNDLGNPDKNDYLARPTLGGEERPYPRRCRTGRPSTKNDPLLEAGSESSLPFYVPRDESFEEVKENALFSSSLQGLLQNIVPTIAAAMSQSDLPLESSSDIDELYIDGLTLNNDEDEKGFTAYLSDVVNHVSIVGERLLKFTLPPIAKGDRFSWLRDSEFARQTIAGVNPVSIELLKEFPIISKLDPAVYGPPESAITKELIEKELNGMSFEEALEMKRLFILDYHDMLLPYIESINSLPEKKTYASRTIFFHTIDGILMPILIELSLAPKSPHSRNKHILP